ncbi:hypothetical protein J1614_006700 [Plenodomus biglobosus]|nr:hypothetical protein J1614_006700 [Plenodomus biglobosus]
MHSLDAQSQTQVQYINSTFTTPPTFLQSIPREPSEQIFKQPTRTIKSHISQASFQKAVLLVNIQVGLLNMLASDFSNYTSVSGSLHNCTGMQVGFCNGTQMHPQGCTCSHCTDKLVERPQNITLGYPTNCTGEGLQRPQNATLAHPKGCTCSQYKGKIGRPQNTPAGHPLDCTDMRLEQTYNITLPPPFNRTYTPCAHNPRLNITLPRPHNNTCPQLTHNPTYTKRSTPQPFPLPNEAIIPICIASLVLVALLTITLSLHLKRRTKPSTTHPLHQDLEASPHPSRLDPALTAALDGGDLGTRADHAAGPLDPPTYPMRKFRPNMKRQSATGGDKPPVWWRDNLQGWEEVDLVDLRDVRL